jgi:Fe-S cluster assembly protein SufD
MEVMSTAVKEMEAKEQFMSNFKDVDFSFDSKASQAARDAAKEGLLKLDFPTTKTEYWKYTRVASLVKKKYGVSASVTPIDITPHCFSEGLCLTFVNGFFREELSTVQVVAGLHLCALSQAKKRYPEAISRHFARLTSSSDEIFTQMNTAFHNDGAFILVEKGTKVIPPIQVIHYSNGQDLIAQPRSLIIAEENSEVRIVSSSENADGKQVLTNEVVEFMLSRNAKVEYNKVQNAGIDNQHIAKEEVTQEEGSFFKINTFTLSGKLIRNNLNIAVTAPNCQTELNGIYLTKGKQHVDNHTIVDHQQPHCESRELYKGVLNEQSTAVFNGRVLVRRAAQKTNAFQSNANILLTDDATINSKPELEIYADDVKCSHGSTTGQLDDEALFYLQARGIDAEKARNMLLYAFAGEVLEKSSVEKLRAAIDHYIAQRYHNQF